MGNIVKLVFQAIATGSGFGKLLGEVKGLNEKMPGLSKAAQIVGASFGTAGAAAGRMVTMLLQGGVWGVAAEGAKHLIDQLGIFKDRSAETKEKLDKLEEASRKFYETINSNSQKSIAKIDAETKRRNEQLDITNRMIKAELQLQKAKAISSGDAGAAESVDRQMANADRTTAMDKAAGAERDAASKVKVAESGLVSAQKAEREANAELAKAEAAYAKAKERSYYLTGGGPNGIGPARKVYTDPKEEHAAVDAARKRLELAEQATDAAKASVEAEREKLKVASQNVKALKAEQEAADAEALAKKMSEGMAAERKRVADEGAAEKKAREDFAAQERARKDKERKERLQRELEDLKKETQKREEQRKKDLQKDIESNRKRADDLRQKLVDAEERAKKARDVLGNAASMDQAGGLSAKRQEALTDDRYRDRRTALILGEKVVRGSDGKWVSAKGRMSNIEQATLDRMNADADVNKAKTERKEIVDRLDKLISKLDQAITI